MVYSGSYATHFFDKWSTFLYLFPSDFLLLGLEFYLNIFLGSGSGFLFWRRLNKGTVLMSGDFIQHHSQSTISPLFDTFGQLPIFSPLVCRCESSYFKVPTSQGEVVPLFVSGGGGILLIFLKRSNIESFCRNRFFF